MNIQSNILPSNSHWIAVRSRNKFALQAVSQNHSFQKVSHERKFKLHVPKEVKFKTHLYRNNHKMTSCIDPVIKSNSTLLLPAILTKKGIISGNYIIHQIFLVRVPPHPSIACTYDTYSNVSFYILRALNHNMSVFQDISNIRWFERHGNRIADEMKIFESKFDLFLFRQLHIC